MIESITSISFASPPDGSMSPAISTSVSVPRSIFNLEGKESREIGVIESIFLLILLFSLLDLDIKDSFFFFLDTTDLSSGAAVRGVPIGVLSTGEYGFPYLLSCFV